MEFEDLGKHCELCRQKDILPFRCNCCNNYYCLTHIIRDAHKCKMANANEVSVIVCPNCDQLIKLLPDVESGILIEEHIRFSCMPQQKKKSRKCPVSGCKEKLTLVNIYKCSSCNQEYCLKHRYQDEHNCAPVKEVSWKDRFLSALRERMIKSKRYHVC